MPRTNGPGARRWVEETPLPKHSQPSAPHRSSAAPLEPLTAAAAVSAAGDAAGGRRPRFHRRRRLARRAEAGLLGLRRAGRAAGRHQAARRRRCAAAASPRFTPPTRPGLRGCCRLASVVIAGSPGQWRSLLHCLASFSGFVLWLQSPAALCGTFSGGTLRSDRVPRGPRPGDDPAAGEGDLADGDDVCPAAGGQPVLHWYTACLPPAFAPDRVQPALSHPHRGPRACRNGAGRLAACRSRLCAAAR